MDSFGPERSSGTLKDRLRGLLKAGAGSLIVVSAVVVTAPSATALPPPVDSVIERIDALRARLALEQVIAERGDAQLSRLAWHAWHNWKDSPYHDQVWNNVANWHNVGYRDPRWQNWQNWHNWHDWNDWNNKY